MLSECQFFPTCCRKPANPKQNSSKFDNGYCDSLCSFSTSQDLESVRSQEVHISRNEFKLSYRQTGFWWLDRSWHSSGTRGTPHKESLLPDTCPPQSLQVVLSTPALLFPLPALPALPLTCPWPRLVCLLFSLIWTLPTRKTCPLMELSCQQLLCAPHIQSHLSDNSPAHL